MLRHSFNNNWTFRKGTDGIFGLSGNQAVPVTLPHDAMILEQRDPSTPNSNATGFYPGGVCTYEKKFSLPAANQERDVYLEFEGIYMNAVISINGDVAAARPYGYSPIRVKANDHLRFDQENVVKVIVRNDAMPNSRWYTGSGIYRDTWLMSGNTLHIKPDGLKITTISADAELALIEVAAEIENTGHTKRSAVLNLSITGKEAPLVVSDQSPFTAFPGRSFVLRKRFALPNARLWDPEEPNLYICDAQILEDQESIDQDSSTFGIRTLSVDAVRGLRINGKPVKLRGTCIHHDNGVIGAVALPRAEERKAELIKAAGFNAIRSAHNPVSEAMLKACDRLGILVMDEAFDMWQKSKATYDYSLVFDDWWERDIEAMVAKDINHPCVILYSIGNEIPESGTPHGAELNRRLAEKVRRLDPTRFVTNGVNGVFSAMPHLPEILSELTAEGILPQDTSGGAPAEEINQFMMNMFRLQDKIIGSKVFKRITAEIFDALDVAGYNYMVSQYERDHQLFPNRIIVGSETTPPDIARIWPLVKKNGHIIGDFTWVGWDYLGEAGCGAFDYEENAGFFKPYPARLAFSGDIDITGHRRPMSYYREIIYGLRSDPYIAVQRVDRHGQKLNKSIWCGSDTVASWSWPGYEGKTAVVEVFSDAGEVELLLNGRSFGRKPAGEANQFMASFEIVYQPGTLEAVNYRGGQACGRMTLVSADEAAALAVDVDRARLRADGADLACLMITLTDEIGRPNLWQQKKVEIKVSGSGSLQGFGSADPYGTEDFSGNSKTTFDGRLLAVIRAADAPGPIRVELAAADCKTRIIDLFAE